MTTGSIDQLTAAQAGDRRAIARLLSLAEAAREQGFVGYRQCGRSSRERSGFIGSRLS